MSRSVEAKVMEGRKRGLSVIGAAMGLALTAPAVAAAADSIRMDGQFSSTISQISGGDPGRYREDQQVREGFSGGLDDLSIEAAKGAWRLTSDLQALNEVDLKMDNRLERENWGYITQHASVYPHYYDGSNRYYDTPPRVYDLDTTLRTLRGDVSVEMGTEVPDRPKTFIGYRHRSRDGETNTYWGGWVRDAAPKNDNILFVQPLQRERDEQSNTLYLGAEHQLAGWSVGLRQNVERFDGVDTYDEPGYYDNGSFQFTRYYRNNPKHTTWTTTASSGRQFLEGKADVNLSYQYAVTHSESVTDVDSFTGSGARHYDEHSLNYLVAEHAGRSHSQATNLQVDYAPSEWVRTWVGGRMQVGKSVGISLRGEEGSEALDTDGSVTAVEETWESKSVNREIGWTENAGVELSVLPKTRLGVDVALDQTRVKYDWLANVTGPASRMASQNEGDWSWLSTVWEHRNSYSISARSWAIPHVTLWTRYRYRIDTVDMDDKQDLASEKVGDPEYEGNTNVDYYYPGRMEDTRRATHEIMIAPTVKLGPRWILNPRFEHRSSHFEVSNDPLEEISAFRSNTVAVGVMGQPIDPLTYSLNVSRQFALTSTRADSFSNSIGKNPRTGATATNYYGAITPDFDASYTSAQSELGYTWHGLTLTGEGGLVDGNGDFDTVLTYGGFSVKGPLAQRQGSTWETRYRFSDYHEDEQNSINDYTAHAVFFMIRTPFELGAQSQ